MARQNERHEDPSSNVCATIWRFRASGHWRCFSDPEPNARFVSTWEAPLTERFWDTGCGHVKTIARLVCRAIMRVAKGV